MKALAAAVALFAAAPPLWAQTATPRADGGLSITCPSGRTATVAPRGTQVLITVRERDGREWGTADMPSSGSGAPNSQNRVGNPARVAEAVCKM